MSARGRLSEWARDESHMGQSVRMHEPQYANPAAIRADVRAVLVELETAERRLRHSEFHRVINRRTARKRGRVIRLLSEKCGRQRAALRQNGGGGKRLSAHERAAAVHHSLRTGP